MLGGGDKLQQLKRWVQLAHLNNVFVYYNEGVGERDEAVFAYARKLHEAGLVFLFQKRADDGLYQYCARMSRPADIHTLDKVSASIHVEPSRQRDAA